MTTYTNSKGEAVEIASMPYPYLCNAINKLEQRVAPLPEEYEALAAMRAERTRRDAEFAAQVAALQAEGFRVEVWPHPEAAQGEYVVIDSLGNPVVRMRGKDENAAWAELMKQRKAST